MEITLSSNLRPRLDELRDKLEHGNVMNNEGLEKRRHDLAIIQKALNEIKGRTQGVSIVQHLAHDICCNLEFVLLHVELTLDAICFSIRNR